MPHHDNFQRYALANPMISVYQLKSRFQGLLRPGTKFLARYGVTANQVTLAAMLGSIAYGLWLGLHSAPLPWLLLPVFLLLRMALNAVDGMLAREHGQASRLGAILNEVGDVVSDLALYLPFAMIASAPLLIVLGVFLAMLTEFVGVLGQALGASRRYDGPMGKSDRAFVYGAFALVVGIYPPSVEATVYVFAVTNVLIVWTCFNRARAILKEMKHV